MGLAARCVGLQARQSVNDWRVLSGLTNPQVAGMEGVAPTSRQQVVDEAGTRAEGPWSKLGALLEGPSPGFPGG